MGFLDWLFKPPKLPGLEQCNVCGRFIKVIKEPATIKEEYMSLGEIQTGLKCEKCGAYYHGRCRPVHCRCKSTAFLDVMVQDSTNLWADIGEGLER